MTAKKSAPIVEPIMTATFWLLLRVARGVDDGGGGGGGGALRVEFRFEFAEGGTEVAEEEEEDLIADVVRLYMALDTAGPPPPCALLVHKTGFGPSCRTMLKSLLVNVGGVGVLASSAAAPRSDTWKWHTQAFPSLRGTRAEPVAETDRLYAGGLALDGDGGSFAGVFRGRRYGMHSGRYRRDSGTRAGGMGRGSWRSRMR